MSNSFLFRHQSLLCQATAEAAKRGEPLPASSCQGCLFLFNHSVVALHSYRHRLASLSFISLSFLHLRFPPLFSKQFSEIAIRADQP